MKGQAILITSGKGGVGKTTVTANLGIALALAGKRTAVVDADIGMRNLDVVLGLENRIVYDLVHVIEGHCRVNQALVKDRRLENLFLLPAAQIRDQSAVKEEQMAALVNELKESFEYVLVDCPAGVEDGFRNAIAGTDRAIVVTNPEMSAIRDADRAIGKIENYVNSKIEPQKKELRVIKAEIQRITLKNAESPDPELMAYLDKLKARQATLKAEIKSSNDYTIHLLLNRYNPAMVNKGEMVSQEDVGANLNIPFIGIIPESKDIIVSTNLGKPIALEEKSIIANAFGRIAERVQGIPCPFPQFAEASEMGFFTRMKRFMGMGRVEA